MYRKTCKLQYNKKDVVFLIERRIFMSGKRITFKQRIIIQSLVENSSTKSINEIAKATSLTRNTIFREIKNRRTLYS